MMAFHSQTASTPREALAKPRGVKGDNSGIVDLNERRALFLEQLTQFAAERKKEEALSRQDLAGLPPETQTQAQRQSLLDNWAHMCAVDPSLDCAGAVLTIITCMSGNREGACSVSVPRIAKFLSRSDRAVQNVLTRLEELQVIVIERRAGATSLLTPWVHQSFGQFRDALTWIMDVRAPTSERGKPGRPKLAAASLEIPPKHASPLISIEENVEENQAKPDNTPEVSFTPEASFAPEAWQQIPPKHASDNMKGDMKDRSEVSVANQSSHAPETTLLDVDEGKPAKRKARATGKRPWDWVHESERVGLGEVCKAYAAERGWPPGHLRDRLIAFDNHQRINKPVSADWEASLLQWLGDPRFQPRTARSGGRISISDQMDDVAANWRKN